MEIHDLSSFCILFLFLFAIDFSPSFAQFFTHSFTRLPQILPVKELQFQTAFAKAPFYLWILSDLWGRFFHGPPE